MPARLCPPSPARVSALDVVQHARERVLASRRLTNEVFDAAALRGDRPFDAAQLLCSHPQVPNHRDVEEADHCDLRWTAQLGGDVLELAGEPVEERVLAV